MTMSQLMIFVTYLKLYEHQCRRICATRTASDWDMVVNIFLAGATTWKPGKRSCQTEWKIHWSKKHSRMPGWWRRLFAAKFSASKFAEAAAFSFSISISEIRQRSCSSSTLLKSLFTCKSRRTVNGALVATRKIQVTATIKSTLYQQSKVQQW